MNKQIKKYEFTSLEDCTQKTSEYFKKQIEVFEDHAQKISNIRNDLRDKLYTYVSYYRTQSKVPEEVDTFSMENLYSLCCDFIGKSKKEIASTNTQNILRVVCKSVVLLMDSDEDETIKVSLFNHGKTETKVARVKSNPNNKDKDLSFRIVKGDLVADYNYFKPEFKVYDKELKQQIPVENTDETQIPLNDTMINKMYSELHKASRTPDTENSDDSEGDSASELVAEWNDYLSEWINDDDSIADLNADDDFKKEFSRLKSYVSKLTDEMLRVSNEDASTDDVIKVNKEALKKTA